MTNVHGIQAKQVAKYVLLPGILPRVKGLFGSGFGYIAFLMANIYNIVRLLPPSHPYLNPQNIGRYSVRHVISEAANNLVVKKENIDQLIIFAALLAGVVILLLQIVLVVYAYFVQPALAGPGPSGNFTSIFQTQFPEKDIAFMLLDQVFGVPDLFNSCIEQLTQCDPKVPANTVFPWPFHTAMHTMYQFYSLGLLFIGALIFLYFVVVVVAETAATGTPFGQRFQNVWVPIRLVVALGLLVPINYGLNSGQYITLFAAKIGSSFATNGWLTYNTVLKDGNSGSNVFSTGGTNPTGERESLLALPNSPDITPVVAFMSMVQACSYAYWHMDQNAALNFIPPSNFFDIKPYLVKMPLDWFGGGQGQKPFEEVTPSTPYTDALDFYQNGDITIRFGRHDETEYSEEKGNVEPTCGEIRIHIGSLKHKGQGATVGGPDMVQEYYFNLIKSMWFGADGSYNSQSELITLSQRFMAIALPGVQDQNGTYMQCLIGCSNQWLPNCVSECDSQTPTADAKQNVGDQYQTLLNGKIVTAWNLYNQNAQDIEISDDVLKRGWGGAGIWFNTISQTNGTFIDSVVNVPTIVSMPKVMEQVREQKLEHDSNITDLLIFQPYMSNGEPVKLENSDHTTIAKALNGYYLYWVEDGLNQARMDKEITGSIFEDIMNMFFGTSGLFAMRGQNMHIHPLAQLTAVGKSLVDSAVRNVVGSAVFAVMGGPAAAFSKHFGAPMQAISSFLVTTAFVGLTAGFVLFYILPFLPFVYFFFAVGSWLKSIFEAMVGVPLWALAHLRLDGEGLPGDSAANGYFLLFEIFIRPILTVFGLIAAMLIFTTQVRVLNFIWLLVVDNITGHESNPVIPLAGEISISRGVIDQFFFTVVYTIICYMLATASFKLIDKIPENILRWMGAGVSAFSDLHDDPVEGLTRYAAMGGLTIGQQATQGIQQFGAGAGGSLTKMIQGTQGIGGPRLPPGGTPPIPPPGG